MSRSLTHLTPRYVWDRAAFALEQRRHPDHPWLTADAVRLLDQLIRPDDIGVEFGSGRSTIWFAKRLSHLTSIEDSREWSAKVRGMLQRDQVASKVDYRAIEDPDIYVAQAGTFADASVDFCLIDGAERDRCAEAMIPKMKSGGIFVVDNVNWFMPNPETRSPSSRRSGYGSEAWERVGRAISGWRRIWTSNGVTDTGVWIKPTP